MDERNRDRRKSSRRFRSNRKRRSSKLNKNVNFSRKRKQSNLNKRSSISNKILFKNKFNNNSKSLNKKKTKIKPLFIFNLIKKNIKKYCWYSLILFIILYILINNSLISSIIILLILINLIILLIIYLFRPFIWVNRLDLSDDLKYFGLKLLSIILFVGIIAFFFGFGFTDMYFLPVRETLLDKINIVLFQIFYFAALLWLLILSAFLGLRKKRRAKGIYIWNN